MNKAILISTLLVTLVIGTTFAISAINKNSLKGPVVEKKMKIITTNYPTYFFTSEIGGEKVTVINITPLGIDPHDFEPTPRDILKIKESDLLLLRGGNFEPWSRNITTLLEGNALKVIDLSRQIGDSNDPHTWLDPKLAIAEVEIIKESLYNLDSNSRPYYEERASNLIKKLDSLEASFSKSIKNCRQKTIITTHSSINYLGQRYGFGVDSLLGLNPEGEPSPRKLAEIVSKIKTKNIKYLLTEPLLSRKYADTLSKETGIKYLEFNPIENLTEIEKREEVNYFILQENNLKSIKEALECQ